jgi:hypothetical protein
MAGQPFFRPHSDTLKMFLINGLTALRMNHAQSCLQAEALKAGIAPSGKMWQMT